MSRGKLELKSCQKGKRYYFWNELKKENKINKEKQKEYCISSFQFMCNSFFFESIAKTILSIPIYVKEIEVLGSRYLIFDVNLGIDSS